MITKRQILGYRGPDRRREAAAFSSRYRGPDRRQAQYAAKPGRSYGSTTILVISAVVLLAIAARALVVRGQDLTVTYAALRDTGAGLMLVAGTVVVIVWLLTGRAARAYDGIALLTAAIGVLAMGGPWGDLMHQRVVDIAVSPAARLAFAIPAVALLLRAPTADQVDSSLRPARVLATGGGTTAVVLGIELVVRAAGPIDNSTLLAAVMGLVAAGWLAAGVVRWIRSQPDNKAAEERWFAGALVGQGIGLALVAVGLATSFGWAVGGALVQVLASAAAAVWAVSLLLAVLRSAATRTLHLAGELNEMTQVLADETSTRHRLIHDARNVVTAIRAANGALERHGDRLDAELQQRLQVAVGTEFIRLQRLLEETTESSIPESIGPG